MAHGLLAGDAGGDAAYLHTLVVYHIPATLPVEQLHQRAAAVEIHIDTAVGRLTAKTADKAAQRLNSLAQVYTRAVDHELVCFVQTKHKSTYFAGAKVRSPWQMQNKSKMGWLQRYIKTNKLYCAEKLFSVFNTDMKILV